MKVIKKEICFKQNEIYPSGTPDRPHLWSFVLKFKKPSFKNQQLVVPYICFGLNGKPVGFDLAEDIPITAFSNLLIAKQVKKLLKQFKKEVNQSKNIKSVFVYTCKLKNDDKHIGFVASAHELVKFPREKLIEHLGRIQKDIV